MNKFAGVIVMIALLGPGARLAPEKKVIFPPGARQGGTYSQGILTDGTLFISGQGGEDQMVKIPRDFEAEVKQCLDNVGAILAAGRNVTSERRQRAGVSDGCRQVPAYECSVYEFLHRFQGRRGPR